MDLKLTVPAGRENLGHETVSCTLFSLRSFRHLECTLEPDMGQLVIVYYQLH